MGNEDRGDKLGTRMRPTQDRTCVKCGVTFQGRPPAKYCEAHAPRRKSHYLDRAPTRQTAERLVIAEDMLLRGYSPQRVSAILAREWNISPAKVEQDYVRTVMRVWSASARAEDRETRRDRLRARFEDGFRRAATKRTLRKRTQVVPDENGKPKVVTVTEEVDAPDFGAMVAFGRLLVDIDGLSTINVAATHAHTISTAMAKIIAQRKAVADGKPRVIEALKTIAADPLDAKLGLEPEIGGHYANGSGKKLNGS